jgi:hypothetical protein
MALDVAQCAYFITGKMMPAASRLGRQLEEAPTALRAANLPVALIGGLALAPYNVIRATQDIDLLADGNDVDAITAVVRALGYQSMYRSDDAANFLRGDERIDFIFPRRPIARRLLSGALRLGTSLGSIPGVSKEGLIGFKLQGLANDPRRTQDAEDIRALLCANQGAMNLIEVREYFRLFDREALLDQWLHELAGTSGE